MKKTLVALATLAATGAFAQVTISGSVNYGYKVNAAGTSSVAGLKGDRNNLTFSATESIEGGLTASTMLQFRARAQDGEAAYYSSSATGKGQSLMEQVKLSISGGFGSLDMGRFTNKFGNVGHFMEDSAYGATTTTLYGRNSGQVQYSTPSLSGFSGSYIYARADANKYPSGTASGNGFVVDTTQINNDLAIFNVNYEMGPLAAQISNITGMTGEKGTAWTVVYDLGSGLRANVAQFRQGGDIGSTTWTSTATTQTSVAKHTSTELGVEWKTGPWTLAATMQMNDKDLGVGKTDGGTKLTKQGYKAYYGLSKTTFLEFEASNTSNGVTTADNGTAYYIGARKTF